MSKTEVAIVVIIMASGIASIIGLHLHTNQPVAPYTPTPPQDNEALAITAPSTESCVKPVCNGECIIINGEDHPTWHEYCDVNADCNQPQECHNGFCIDPVSLPITGR